MSVCLCLYTNSDNFIEHELIAMISCVFGCDEKEWINGDPEDGMCIYIYIHRFFLADIVYI